MSDIKDAEGNEGNSGFSDEWKRLARSDDGQGESPPGETDRHEPHDGEEQRGPGDEPAPTEAAPQEPAPSENTDDIWAEAPAHYREAYEAERKARERAENAIRSNNGRLSKAEREAAELRARLTAQQPQPAAAPGAEAPSGAEAQDPAVDELTRVASEYEDVGKPLVDEILKLRGQVEALTRNDASQAEQRQVREELEFKEYLAAQEQLLSEEHDDWQQVVLKPEFVDWVQTGPQFIRDGIARNGNGIVDGAEASEILSLFKQKHGIAGTPNPLAAKRERQLEGARSIPGSSPGVTPQGKPDDFKSEWKRLGAVEAAKERRTAAR